MIRAIRTASCLVLALGCFAVAPRAAQPAKPARSETTVATLWKTRTALAGKTVTVRGKVMKFNGGILGVNWIHIQDGTGDEKDGSNDITVTTATTAMVAKVGETIAVTGTVTVNKDLGSGYKYPVIIEKASIAR